MRVTFKQITLIALGVLVWASSAQAKSLTECDVVLKPDIYQMEERSFEYLSVLKLVTEENYAQMQEKHRATIPKYFDGTYNKFQEEIRKSGELNTFDRTTDEARSLLTSTVSPTAIAAWSACMADNGIFAYVDMQHVTDTTAMIKVIWRSDLGVGLKDVDLSVTGGTLNQRQLRRLREMGNSKNGFIGDYSILVTRKNADQIVTGSVEGTASDRSRTFQFAIPRQPPVPTCTANDLRPLVVNHGGQTIEAVLDIAPARCDRIIDVFAENWAESTEPQETWFSLDVKADGQGIYSHRLGLYPSGVSRLSSRVSQASPNRPGGPPDTTKTEHFLARNKALRVVARANNGHGRHIGVKLELTPRKADQ